VFKEVIELIDTETGKVGQSLPIVTGSVQRGGGGFGPPAPGGMLFSPDGKTLVAYADTDKLAQWDVATGRKRLIALPQGLLQAPAHVAAISPDGRCLAVDVRGQAVVLIELATGTERKVFGKALSPQKKVGIGGGLPMDQVAVIPISGGSAMGQVGAHSVALSSDGQRLAYAGNDRKVHILDVTTGEELRSFAGHSGAITAVAFAGDGKRVASVSTDTTALIWDVAALKAAPRPL